jgi:uncharacterized membrane protein HdeD (DUF308 family)
MSDSSLGSDGLHQLTSDWWVALVVGAISLAAGVIVLAKPSNSLATLAVVAGVFVLLDGIFALANALSRRTESRGLVAILGVLSVVVGTILIRHPIRGVTAIALLVGIWLIAAGVVRLVAAFEVDEHRLRRVGVALVLGIAGVVIVASPHIGYATLALIAGLGFIGYGAGMLLLGWAMHTVHTEPVPPPRHETVAT